jgi:signal transduction histidine kinase
MIVLEPERRLTEMESRLERLAAWIPFALLVASILLDLLVGSAPLGDRVFTAGIAVLAGLWLVSRFVVPKAWTERQVWRSVYVVGLLLFTAVLVTLSPQYGLFAWSNYLTTWSLLPGGWRPVGVTAAALLHIGTIYGGPRVILGFGPAGIAGFLIVVAVVVGLVMVGSRITDVTTARSEHRRRMVGELAEANRRLEELIEENAGLHAQLLAQAREAGMLDERQRMAMEIHDTLAQGLTGIITQVQAATNAHDRPEDWRRHLDNVARLARESLSEARRSVHAVSPEPLEAARLPEAMAAVAGGWSEVTGVPATVTTTGTVRPLHPEVEVTVLRVAQEALANVAKHAGASSVGVTISYMEDLVTLDVLDDGAGFDPAGVPERAGGDGAGPSPQGGFGLTGMRQRVGRLGGTLAVESAPGEGTAVSAAVPAIPRDAPDA